MSSFVALAPSASPAPVILKLTDPDQARRQRGRSIAAVCRIEERKPGLWVVPGEAGGGSYWVRMDGDPPTCTCEDFAKRQRACKHIHAVRAVIQRRAEPACAELVAPAEATDAAGPSAVREPMSAPAPDLPAGLAGVQRGADPREVRVPGAPDRSLPGHPRAAEGPRGGQERGPAPGADGGSGGRLRLEGLHDRLGAPRLTDMRDAKDKGHLSHPPHYSAVFRYLEDPGDDADLQGPHRGEPRPLRSIEVDFVIDSTGFSTSRFVPGSTTSTGSCAGSTTGSRPT